MTKQKKIKIDFQENEYNASMQIFWNKDAIKQKIDKELKKIFIDYDYKISNYKNVLNEFYNLIYEQKKDTNTLNLSGEKLVELLQIDIKNLIKFQNEMQRQSGEDIQEPTIEDFTVYAETPEEIAKYNDCMAVIDALNKFDKYEIPTRKNNYVSFIPFIDYDLENEGFKPSAYFIKSGIYV